MIENKKPPGRGFRHVSTRLVFWTLLLAVATQLPLAIYVESETQRTVLDTIRDNGRYLVALTIQRIGEKRRFIERGARSLAERLTDRPSIGYEPEAFQREVQAFVLSSPDVYGSTVAFEPFAFREDTDRFSPYFYIDANGDIAHADLADAEYDYRSRDWYRVPIETRQASWSGPHVDGGGGNVAVATYSFPFYLDDRPLGVVTAELGLSHLEAIIAEFELNDLGYCFIIDRSGRFLFHPNGDHLKGRTIFDLASRSRSGDLERIAREMLANEHGVIMGYQSVHTGRTGVLVYDTDATSGWSVGLVLHRDVMHAGLIRLTWIRAIVGAFGMLAIVAIIVVTARRVTDPLRSLAQATADVARGELDGYLPPARTVDEIGTLTHAFHLMREDLGQHIADLKAATAARQKLESELAIAHEIQLAMVPQRGAAVERASRFDLAAELIPASSVGGDWFDYFFLGRDRLAVVVGDVCGKGVPAALLMARTVSSIRAATREVQTPEAILSIANQEFARDNEACMFATVFCGVLSLDSGRLQYSSAGHDAPVVQRLNETVDILEVDGALPLGIVEGTQYTRRERMLGADETLVLYTDGVTEAFNPNREVFGDGRLAEAIATSPVSSPAALNRSILASVRAFTRGAPPSDDITLLAISWHHER